MYKTYTTFCDYFDNPEFTKVKNVGELSIYACAVNVQLLSSYRYIICIVPKDMRLMGSLCKMTDLQWKVLQTRDLERPYPSVKYKHSYIAKHGGVYESPIVKVDQTQDKNCVYKCSGLPITITLLHNEALLYAYPSTGVLNSALETYNTIIELI
jgi:hypothetical protein